MAKGMDPLGDIPSDSDESDAGEEAPAPAPAPGTQADPALLKKLEFFNTGSKEKD